MTALSSGTLMNRSRSTSVWKVGSFSTRSPAASTVTVVAEPATGRTSLRLAPTIERISKLWLTGANPLARTVIRYGLNGTFVKTNWPVASVVTVRSRPLTSLTRWTVALGTTAPEGSVTVPRTAPELLPCAVAPSAANIRTRMGKMRRIAPSLYGIGSLHVMAESCERLAAALLASASTVHLGQLFKSNASL